MACSHGCGAWMDSKGTVGSMTTKAPDARAATISAAPAVPSPGSRVVVRDEEWLVLRTDPTSDGGFLLTCDGVSELVRGRSALFLTGLEDEIEILDPANTVLVPDTSRTYNDS